ncbi:uncharacterized protein KGF55_002011 [Candida pseudojiufengensis]|uniref:uncharacterized protein n=1 Tax=Candida pseudojiufengensis TaxID=497109 RepID=UPI0022255C1D|nr:uncharacterized protein KGF55_002011 [Candida pseudojiufengensis]KAI5964069.1 hypothetical protein KGF55_002011 [Candida pseudojiufengensis]
MDDITIQSQSPIHLQKSPSKILSNNNSLLNKGKDYDEIERRFADILLKYDQLKLEKQQIEEELELKQGEINILQLENRTCKDDIQMLEMKLQEIEDISIKNESMYKQVVEGLRKKIQILNSNNVVPDQELVTKYEKLLKDYKILENEFDVEKESKSVLMDQIEYLTHKNEELTPTTDEEIMDEFINTEHTTSLDEDSGSVKMTSHFQFPSPPKQHFPPSPDPAIKNLKRQSLPIDLKKEFVLSPFKLAPTTEEETSIRPKPTHQRYNSHDIIPIKVEFENDSEKRFSSAPVIEEDEVNQYRNEALFALNGYDESSEIESSSKRSSYYGNQTRQEITKLQFELQSLKLHNEKLLSYIGFELQKQKKNLKKLAKRQSMTFEYSDAKLIEESKNLLINEKRVLRSVSINSVPPEDSQNFVNDKIVKKFASQVFQQPIEEESSEEESEEEETGVLNHIKSYVLGKKHKPKDELVDDNLKFKFLTIALGIMIIGFKLTPKNSS